MDKLRTRLSSEAERDASQEVDRLHHEAAGVRRALQRRTRARAYCRFACRRRSPACRAPSTARAHLAAEQRTCRTRRRRVRWPPLAPTLPAIRSSRPSRRSRPGALRGATALIGAAPSSERKAQTAAATDRQTQRQHRDRDRARRGIAPPRRLRRRPRLRRTSRARRAGRRASPPQR